MADPTTPAPSSPQSADPPRSTASPEAVAAFAADLRRLRQESGDRTVTALASATGVSKSVVADAFGGRRLPTARTVRALVTAFEQDPDAWLTRRDEIAGVTSAPTPVAAAPRTVRLRSAALLVVAAAVVGAVVSGLVVHAAGTSGAVASPGGGASAQPADSSGAAPSTPGTPSTKSPGLEGSIAVTSGQDPAQTACVNDSVTVATAVRARGTKLEIKFSAACDAAWARITRTDDDALGESVSAAIFEADRPTAADRQTTTEKDVQSAYTTLIVRPTPTTRICATGSLTVDGAPVSLGDAICV